MNIRVFVYRLLGYKTVEELFEELKKGKELSGKEIERARKLSKALLPKGLNYPKEGSIFEATSDVEISYLTHFMAPFTGGEKAILLKGERVRIGNSNQERALTYSAYPLNAEEIEARIIPVSDKNEPTYNGFSLIIDVEILNKSFNQIS